MNAKQQYYFNRSESRKPNSERFQVYLDKRAQNNLNYLTIEFNLQKIRDEVSPKIEVESELPDFAIRGANRRKTDAKGVSGKANTDYFGSSYREEKGLIFYRGPKREFEVVLED